MPAKMNWIVTTAFFVGALASVSAKLCHSANDCGEGQCCMGLDWLTMSNRGLCLSLAKLGRPCSEPESALEYYGGKFFKHCPCGNGMECAPKKEGFDKETQRQKYLKTLQCRKAASTVAPKVTTVSPDEPIKTEATVTDRRPDEVTTTSQPGEETTVPEEITPPETTAPEETIPPETIAPEETIPPETIAPEETIPPEPEETIPAVDIGEGPGGERPRDDDCEDWELSCSPKKEIGEGPGGERPRDDDCEDWELPCSSRKEIGERPEDGVQFPDDCEYWELPCAPKRKIGQGPGGEPPRDDDCEDWEKPC